MRLFVGIFPPAGVLAHLGDALASVRAGAGLRRWQPAERWHVTLAFLGDVAPAQLDLLRTGIAAECATSPVLRLCLAGTGTFHAGRGAGALWIGVDGAGPAQLATRVRGVVPAEDRPFRGHLTVAHWRPPDKPDHGVLAALHSYRGPEWELDEVVLVRSHQGPLPRYERIAAWQVRSG